MYQLDGFKKDFTVDNVEVIVEVFDIQVTKGDYYADNPYDAEDLVEFEYRIIESSEDLDEGSLQDLENLIEIFIKNKEEY